MKKLALWCCFLLFFSSCSTDEEAEVENELLLGSWELIARIGSGSDGLPLWQTVEEDQGYSYTFSEGGLVKSSRYSCAGTYEASGAYMLYLEFACSDGHMQGDFLFEFKDGALILTPEPNPCDEGCDEKFVKTGK